MAITNWITSTEVVSLAVKRGSYDTAIIEGNISLAQMKYLRKFLGDDFFNEINDEIVADNISTDNTALLIYLKPALAYFIVFESFFENEFKQTTKGSMSDLSEFGQKPSAAQLELRRQDLMNKANSWLDLAQEFIRDQRKITSTKYPNYSEGLSDTNQAKNNHYWIPND